MNDEKEKKLAARPPVVVVLGHVDHGKSSILSSIKDFRIIEKESGGITQHIGAYQVDYQGKQITFIDTPGHGAFSAMRSRGAKAADIAILVVSADEGVKLQTKEAISHIQKAQIPMIVAINKIDKIEADPERVKRELSEQGVLLESMGGKVPVVKVSAKTGEGISGLLDLILLVAEMEDLRGDITTPAEGVVIEAYLDANRGPTATLIVKNGTLKRGDVVGVSSTYGKIRVMENFQGEPVEKALPSMPVVVLGFESVPVVGERFRVFSDIKSAQQALVVPTVAPDISQPISASSVEKGPVSEKVLNLIVKADVLGSLEAIEVVLKEIPQDKASLKIIRKEVGGITESDVKLAKGANGIIIGFRVKADSVAKSLAFRERVKIMNFEVIYELAQEVRRLLSKKLEFETIRNDLGKIKVLAIFRTEKSSQIIGGKVIEGEARRGSLLDVYRGQERMGGGKIAELQRNKKVVDKLDKGAECGILYKGDVKIEEGDILEVYMEEKKKGEL